MKKKFFTIASLGLTAVALLALGACKKGGDTSASEQPKEERSLTWTIADFETWETGMQLIRTGNYFGAMYLNTDTQYVKSGKQSMLMHPLGGYRTGTAPLFFFPTSSELFEFDNRDFTDANKITFEFYNAEETPVNVTVGLITNFRTTNEWQTTSFSYEPLAPNQWTTVTYTVDTSALSIGCDVKNIPGVYVAFENANSRDEADAPDVYLDDVVLTRYEVAPEIKELVQVEGNDYIDFEDDWNEYVIGVRNTDLAPKTEIVKASDYKVGPVPAEGEEDTRQPLQAQSGEKVLRLLASPGQKSKTFWPGVTFAEALFKKSIFADLDETDYGRVTFSFDVYNNTPQSVHDQEKEPNGQRFGVNFYNSGGGKTKQYVHYAKPYEWTTFSILLKDLYNDWQARYANDTSLFDNPGEFSILWGEFNVGGEREFFVDNIRFTVEEKDMEAKPEIIVSPFVRKALVGTQVELPTVSVTDKYDLNLPVSLTAQYKEGDTWKDVTLVKGMVPITKAGEYKLVATTTNSLGNTTVKEYPFQGVNEVESGVWADYAYADEKETVHLRTLSETNKTDWAESVTIGGQTREGVVVATAANADQYGAGYLGFRFAEQLLEASGETGWDYFVIDMYIEASVGGINLYSWNNRLFDTVETGKWIQLKITKDMLNQGKSWVNGTGAPVADKVFYNNFADLCGADFSTMFYTTSIKSTSAKSTITYYIDRVTWVKSRNGAYNDGDGYANDIYEAAVVGKKDEE